MRHNRDSVLGVIAGMRIGADLGAALVALAEKHIPEPSAFRRESAALLRQHSIGIRQRMLLVAEGAPAPKPRRVPRIVRLQHRAPAHVTKPERPGPLPWLTDRRLAAGLRLGDLGRAIGVGDDRMCRFERSCRGIRLTPENIAAIAGVLGVPVDEARSRLQRATKTAGRPGGECE